MTRSEAGNLLMVGAGIISALHVGLFSVWVTAIVGNKTDIAFAIAIFGITFMLLNTAFWFISRQKFQQLIIKEGNEEKLSDLITAGLMVPFLMIFVGWLFCVFY